MNEVLNECLFKGSVLESNLNNNLTDTVIGLVLYAAKEKPASQFWKEAAELVNIKIKNKKT